MRTLIRQTPFRNTDTFWGERGRFPADWISHPDATPRGSDDTARPIVMAFRRRFRIDQARTIRVHVTADERYELWLDGARIGREQCIIDGRAAIGCAGFEFFQARGFDQFGDRNAGHGGVA